MKNKKVLLFLLLAVLFMPVVARAEKQYQERKIVDFVFAVEDEKGRDFSELNFKLKSLDGKIEYDSFEYVEGWWRDDNYCTNIYHFRESNYSSFTRNKDTSEILKTFFTEEDIQKLENGRIDELGLESEDAISLSTISTYSNPYCSQLNSSYKAYYKFVPLLLEEVNFPTDYEPIKKVIYGFVLIVPIDNTYYVNFNLISNVSPSYTIFRSDWYYLPPRCDTGQPYEVNNKVVLYANNNIYLMNNVFYKYLDYNRRGAVNYSAELVQGSNAYGTIIGSTTPATPGYFNRSRDIYNYSTIEEPKSYTNYAPRNQSMNIVEDNNDLARVNTYVVFVKTPSNAVAIPDTLKNVGIPIFIFTIVCIGMGIFVLLKKKSTKEEKEVQE